MLDFRKCELGIPFSDDDVAAEDNLHSSPEGSTVHCRNNWFVEGVPSRDRAKPVRHVDHFLLVVGNLNSDAGVVSFKPAGEDGEAC